MSLPPSPGDGPAHDHRPSHSHGHGHGLDGGWSVWLSHPALLVTMVAIAVGAVATVAGLITLWPDGAGRDAAVGEAAELGLVTDRLGATVEAVADGPCSYSTDDDPQRCRTLTFLLDEGPEQGSVVALPEVNLATVVNQVPDLDLGDKVVLGYEPSTNFYFYADRDRGTTLLWLVGLFALVVVALGRARGVLALGAMAVTVAVLVGFVAPSVLDGHDPLLVAIVAASAIAFVSLYLTHGLNPTTTVALGGTLCALGLTLAISSLFFALADFSGFATEEGFTLPLIADVDLASLLLGGAVLGALGALDDVTVTQVATVAELHRRNPDLGVGELVFSGVRVGREHIASTVNTLLLAYAGASMPLLLLFAASNQSLATVANSETVAVEIVRTLCGSIGLVAAVPITTTLVAILVGTATNPAPATTPTADHHRADPVPPVSPPARSTTRPDNGPPPARSTTRPDNGSPPAGSTTRPDNGSPPAGSTTGDALHRRQAHPRPDHGSTPAEPAPPPEETSQPRRPDWVQEALEPDWTEPDAIAPKRSRRRRKPTPGADRDRPPGDTEGNDTDRSDTDWNEFAPRDDFDDT